MPHEDQIHEAYDAFNTGNEATLRAALGGLLHDHVTWYDESQQGAQPIHGKAAVIDLLVEMQGNDVPAELVAVRAADDRALTLDSTHQGAHLCADRVVFEGDLVKEIWYCDAHSHEHR